MNFKNIEITFVETNGIKFVGEYDNQRYITSVFRDSINTFEKSENLNVLPKNVNKELWKFLDKNKDELFEILLNNEGVNTYKVEEEQ